MSGIAKISPDNYATYQDILANTQIFYGCKNDLINEFISNSTIQSVQKGEKVYNNFDKANWFYLVLQGWVKLYRETMDGNEAVVDVMGKNEIYGELAMLQDFQYSENCVAVENTELMRLPLGLLSQKIEEVPKLALNLLKHSANVKRRKNKEIEHRGVQNASQRIGCFLLTMCNGSKTNSSTLYLPYDKILISAKLGMQPETFSRALAKLKASTTIQVKGDTIEIPDIANLSEFCCSACSSSFPCEE